MIKTYLATHRKSLIAAIGLVVTLVQQALPHWSGTAGVTAAAAALTWVLVHEIPNAPAPGAPTSAALTVDTLMPTVRKLYGELSAELAASTTAAAAPAAPSSSSPTSSAGPGAP